MKPVVSEQWIVASESSHTAFLCRSKQPSGYATTTELTCAAKFDSRDEADEARSRFEEMWRMHSQGGWKVLQAVTRVTFRET